MSELPRIGDTAFVCPLCGWRGKLDECAPAVDSEGNYGCPVPDCGGIAQREAETPRRGGG
jgi:hypothetical protein